MGISIWSHQTTFPILNLFCISYKVSITSKLREYLSEFVLNSLLGPLAEISPTQCMSWSLNPFSTTSIVPPSVNTSQNSQYYSYRLLRSLQTNWTSGQLTHCPYYCSFSALDSGTIVPPFLVGDHLFEWKSIYYQLPIFTVLISVQCSSRL